MKNAITIIAQNCDLKNKTSKKLAKTLNMFFADINSLIKYDLINIKKVIKEAGLEYYNKVETKAVKNVSTYENTVITLDLNTFFNNDNYNILKKNSLVIYLSQTREDFEKELNNIPFIRVMPSQANFFFLEVLPPYKPKQLCAILLKAVIISL